MDDLSVFKKLERKHYCYNEDIVDMYPLRDTVIYWLLKINKEEDIFNNIIFLTIKMFDNFLYNIEKNISEDIEFYKMILLSYLYLAMKYENEYGSYTIEVFEELLKNNCDQYKVIDIVNIEPMTSDVINWEFHTVTVYDFIKIFAIDMKMYKYVKNQAILLAKLFSCYYITNENKPSDLALICIYISNKLLSINCDNLLDYMKSNRLDIDYILESSENLYMFYEDLICEEDICNLIFN